MQVSYNKTLFINAAIVEISILSKFFKKNMRAISAIKHF